MELIGLHKKKKITITTESSAEVRKLYKRWTLYAGQQREYYAFNDNYFKMLLTCCANVDIATVERSSCNTATTQYSLPTFVLQLYVPTAYQR